MRSNLPHVLQVLGRHRFGMLVAFSLLVGFATRAAEAEFLRAINLNGPALTIDGRPAVLYEDTPESAPVVLRVGTVGEAAVLEVEDAGPGIAPADARRVFERFYRTDASRTRASGGTGLGLSIVDALVRAHGGRVSVRTATGQGCRFRVEIPRVNETEFSPVPPALP